MAAAPQNQGRGTQVQTEMSFTDVTLIDDSGYPDVFGTRVRIAHSEEVLEDFDFSQWSEEIAGEVPGSPTPRPYVVTLGKKMGRYQVGSVAQLLIGKASTPWAAGLQAQQLSAPPNTVLARATISLHTLESNGEIASQLMKTSENYRLDEQTSTTKQWQTGISTELVDGPRSILAHTYEVNAEEVIIRTVILIPIAQNESWSAVLSAAATTDDISETRRKAVLEQSIREADPCLPISSAPPGQIGLKLDIVNKS